MITISLCLSDIPKEKIKQGENGKKYINLILSERKQVGNYGETHALSISKTKEERDMNVDTIYVGSGKEYSKKTVSAEDIDNMPEAESDDLPF